MKIIVVGCGRIGSDLAYRLFKRGHRVVVIDAIAAAFTSLPADFQGRFVEGDSLDREVLTRAGISDADALAAVTDSDALNMAIGHMARTIYKVPNVVCRNYDPTNRKLVEMFGLQLVSSSSWGAQRIEELLYHQEIKTVFSAGNGEIEVYEVIITNKCDGSMLGDLFTVAETKVVSVSRAGTANFPTDDMILKMGDVVHVAATFEGIEAIRQQLCQISGT